MAYPLLHALQDRTTPFCLRVPWTSSGTDKTPRDGCERCVTPSPADPTHPRRRYDAQTAPAARALASRAYSAPSGGAVTDVEPDLAAQNVFKNEKGFAKVGWCKLGHVTILCGTVLGRMTTLSGAVRVGMCSVT